MYDWCAGKHKSMRGRTSCAVTWLFRKHYSTIVTGAQLLCLILHAVHQQASIYLYLSKLWDVGAYLLHLMIRSQIRRAVEA